MPMYGLRILEIFEIELHIIKPLEGKVSGEKMAKVLSVPLNYTRLKDSRWPGKIKCIYLCMI
jgi:hypothetical protein